MTRGAENAERRTSMLTDGDIDRIGDAFDRKMQGMFEMIGYDISAPDSRAAIREDHAFVRDVRKAKGTLIASFITGIGSSIILWVYYFLGKTPPHP